MKIVFFGTPHFAAEVLKALREGEVQIAAIVTQPDRPQGRRLQLAPSAVKQIASEILPNIPLFQPEKASEPLFLERLAAFGADLFVVVAYGQILSRKLLAIPPLGCINLHASLLPRYRGAAPIHRALLNGETQTGVCVQKMVYELDAGDVIDETKIDLPEDLTFGELEQKLCDLAKPLLLSVIKRYQKGIPSGKPQDPFQVCFAPKVSPEEAEVDWTKDAKNLHNLIRAHSPRPGAWCMVQIGSEKKRLKILRSKFVPRNGSAGVLLSFQNGECIVAAASGALQLLQVQPEGKKPMSVADWARGLSAAPKFHFVS